MLKRVLIVGAGGMGRETLLYSRDMAAQGAPIDVRGFLDDDLHALDKYSLDVSVVGSVQGYAPKPEDQFVVAVGDPAVRRSIVERLTDRGAQFATVVHPTAYVAVGAQLGAGCILAPFAFVGPESQLSPHVILSPYASVGHDSVVGEFCFFAPYATVNGNVRLGREVYLGTHATVVLGKTVGGYSKISAGSVALRDVPEGALVVGNPGQARVMFAVPNSGAANSGAQNSGAQNSGAQNSGAQNSGAPNSGAPNSGAPNSGA